MSPNARAAAALLGMAAVGAGLYQLAMHVSLVEHPPAFLVGAAPRASSAPDAAPPVRDPRPDILLFTIDTLRADHTSMQGYSRATTPTIDRVAARGTRFARAYSTSTWTVPALASLVSGVLPSEHGVQHGLRVGGDVVDQEILSADLPSLATSLHDAGYRTVGVTTNVHLTELLGFARGFDSYESLSFVDVDEVSTHVAAHLDALRTSEEPFFLWVHVVDPHSPYHAVQPIFDTFRPPPATRYPPLEHVAVAELLDAQMEANHIPQADGLDYVVAAYDSEVRAVDDYLSTLLVALADRNLAVVVAADHGEEFREHLGFGHGHTAFDEVARVPLVVSVPGASAHVVETPVSLLDVLPTVLEIASVDAPERAAGRSLLGATRGETIEERDAIIETGRGHIVIQAIVRGTTKYGRAVSPMTLERLFDLAADPGEQTDLMETSPEIAATLRTRLDEVIAAAAARRPAVSTSPVEMNDRLRAQLEALGYAQ